MQAGKTVLMGNNSVAEDTSYKRIVSSSILDSPISFANEERYFPINRGPESVVCRAMKKSGCSNQKTRRLYGALWCNGST